MRALILTPGANYPDPWAWAYDVEARALAAAGLAVTPCPWDAVGDVAGFDLILPLVAWGYDQRPAEWHALLDRAEAAHWPMVNPPALLRWNSDKAYLAQLAAAGIATVPSHAVAALCEADLAEARTRFDCETLVVKPPVSASAVGTHRLAPGDPIPAAVAGRAMLIQPFLASIATRGELSLMLFGGVFSHAVVKRPKAGDFRVQPHLGGTETPVAPPEGAIDLAKAALAAAPAPATYARVDLIPADDGTLQIIELELIEPALWLNHAPDQGAAFAAAIKAAA